MLIADSLEYHSREQKSQWWRFFSKESFDEIEILEDRECIMIKTQTKDTIDQPNKNLSIHYRSLN